MLGYIFKSGCKVSFLKERLHNIPTKPLRTRPMTFTEPLKQKGLRHVPEGVADSKRLEALFENAH